MKIIIQVVILFFITSLSVFAQDTLKVMTYNIYHGESFYDRGNSNLEEIANLIIKIDPDFVAFQEVDSLTARSSVFNEGEPENLMDTLSQLTGMYGYFGKAIDYDGGGYGEGILSKKPFRSYKLMLPIPLGGEDRTVLMLDAETESGKAFVFAGTHLCHQFPENRMAQVKEMNNYFNGEDKPVIMGGDLNFIPQSMPYEELISSSWKDVAVIHGDAKPTIPYENPSRRIDYLFLSKNAEWEVLDVEVINVNYSDHLPVVATIVLH